MRRETRNSGFTLLEILVSLALLSTAMLIIFQLFSANLRNITVSEDYIVAVAKAESRMKELLDDSKLEENTSTETTADGYTIKAAVEEALQERTDKLQFKVMNIGLTVSWKKGGRKRSVTLNTMKVIRKEL